MADELVYQVALDPTTKAPIFEDLVVGQPVAVRDPQREGAFRALTVTDTFGPPDNDPPWALARGGEWVCRLARIPQIAGNYWHAMFVAPGILNGMHVTRAWFEENFPEGAQIRERPHGGACFNLVPPLVAYVDYAGDRGVVVCARAATGSVTLLTNPTTDEVRGLVNVIKAHQQRRASYKEH